MLQIKIRFQDCLKHIISKHILSCLIILHYTLTKKAGAKNVCSIFDMNNLNFPDSPRCHTKIHASFCAEQGHVIRIDERSTLFIKNSTDMQLSFMTNDVASKT